MSLDQSYLLENAAADADGSLTVITSVGTCRLADPLGAAAKILPIRRDLTNVYGFVHTSKEILQQLDATHSFAWSVGVATAGPGDTLETVLARADADLYLHKRSRRTA